MFRRLMMVAIVLVSTCTPNRTPLYAQERTRVREVHLASPITDATLGRWNGHRGAWVECIVDAHVEGNVVVLDEVVPGHLRYEGNAIVPECPSFVGYVQPDTTGRCELKPEEHDSFLGSTEVIRIVYCGVGRHHFYLNVHHAEPSTSSPT